MNSKKRGGLGSVLVLGLMCAIMCTGLLFSQVTSVIQGRVTDSSRGVIPGATVRVANEATGLGRTVISGDDGYYRVPDLLVGRYEIRVEQAGFKTLVRRGIELSSQAVVNIDLSLEVGEVQQTVEVLAEAPQIETTVSRISSVLTTQQLEALPIIGRGLTWLASNTPGVQGKAEDTRAGNCCDGMSTFGGPALSSGGSENVPSFYLDGTALHFGDDTSWNLAFTPNQDAVSEVRVSTNPTSAEDGIYSGVQVQMVTKSGTNGFHGTGQFTTLEDQFNALPYGAKKADVGPWHQRYYGGTIGGPIKKDRLFFFAAYEGLREVRSAASATEVTVETKEFADWVASTRPNSIANQLLKKNPPLHYAEKGLVDVNGDGIMDIGTVAMDVPSRRTAYQLNSRVDYQTANAQDRFYGTYWRTRVDSPYPDIRPTFDFAQQTGADFISAAHTHSFGTNKLNEVRFSTFSQPWLNEFKDRNIYSLPCIVTNDGISFPSSSTGSGGCGYTYELWYNRNYDVRDVFVLNRGAQSWKFGGSYRRMYATDPSYLTGDTPTYNFTNIIDFANDTPYLEMRAVDAGTGKQRDTFIEFKNEQYNFFAENSWRVRQGLTLNLGLRWDYYLPRQLGGISRPKDTYGPLFTADQLNAQGVIALRNQKVERSHDPDLNNFGPRISIAWDPTGQGRMVIRGGFFVLYNENNTLATYRNYYANPPGSSVLSAGAEYGIPIVYGVAPEGSRDFPINPGFKGTAIDPALGIYVGTKPSLTGWALDTQEPRVYDFNVAVQRQIFGSLAVTAAYHHRRTPGFMYGANVNRFSGDMVDGLLNRLNPYYGSITANANLGRRIYQGLIFEANKRFSQGWQLMGSYGYHNSKSNGGGATEVFQPQVDWARDEPATHTLKMNALWELPFLRSRKDAVGSVLGGWQLATIWNFESGGKFNPTTSAQYGKGGDFNADGQRSDRPDLPTSDIPTSYSKAEWMKGAIAASAFPLPAPGSIRNGTLPRNYFTGPGYARIDASLAKTFPIKESLKFEFQLQAANLLNRVNIRGVSGALTSASFARATAFYPMRSVQMVAKVIF